jgi:5-methylcytosine-specific restriction enzyme subunit McrC
MEGPVELFLTEGVASCFSRDEFSESLALTIYNANCGVEVEFTSPATGFKYRLRSKSLVGQVAVGSVALIRIQPKVEVARLFEMLDVAYALRSFRLYDGLTSVDTIDGVFGKLASILAKRCLHRARRGLYRSYVQFDEELSEVRGHVAIRKTLEQIATGRVSIHCVYEEHLADIEENQLLLWTLAAAGRIEFADPKVQSDVRAARRALSGTVSMREVSSTRCVGRLYNRLCEDYEPMHSICRLILECAGPGVNRGSHLTIPFTVNMASLFEMFVSEWLRVNLRPGMSLKSQHKANLDQSGDLSFRIDIVLFDSMQKPVAVLDTKYKRDTSASEEDVQQVVAYALKMGVKQAYLVYPSLDTRPVDVLVGPSAEPEESVRVRSVVFDLGRDLPAAGQTFLRAVDASY